MKRNRNNISFFNMSMLDIITGALGAFIILALMMIPAFLKNPELQDEVEKLSGKISGLTRKNQMLLDRMNALKKKLSIKDEDLENYISIIENLKTKMQFKSIQLKEVFALLENIKDALNIQSNDEIIPTLQKLEDQAKMGFVLDKKKMVFLVDMSGSMDDDHQSLTKIKQLKVGLKMLIATMDDTYQTDIITYSGRNSGSYNTNTLWGKLNYVTEDRRYDQLYTYLETQKVGGGTPTGKALEYVFKTYKDIGAIVLLSDGVPDTNTIDIRKKVRKLNKDREIKIVSIGIGEDFLKRKNTSAVNFLQNLSAENNGFFVGF